MPLRCEHCGSSTFRLRRSEGAAEAECTSCGKVIPNAVLHAASGLLASDATEDDGKPTQ
jgi:transcription initiation factor TFIIIB Brf1 subunit/transcription initiation factor TFIIB